MAPAEHAVRLAARLDGAVALDLEVRATRDVADGLRELDLVGTLHGFAPWPGQDLMVHVPPGADAARWRRYTVRRRDAESGAVVLWVTTTTNGPGASWARAASRGSRVDAVGPRGKIALDATAARHLFVVDASGLAAACAMAEGARAGTSVAVVALLDAAHRPDDLAAIAPSPSSAGATASFVVVDPGDPVALDHALDDALDESRDGPDGVAPPDAAAYVFGELARTRAVAASLAARGVDAARVAAKPYWRADRANEDHGEPDRG
jgi:NADPH-dependent ferric siderophore reductase